ncbi:hypothetical protein VNO78_16085 [Psophocarpus tetragonolobus]|uniref:Uncharacterized protein n=1 Tax=Psophocarpus tetragonolobus TaxID=3891 RepID=A0AAN9SGJ0_PSOTE
MEVQPYFKIFEQFLKAVNPNISQREVDGRIASDFPIWFRTYVAYQDAKSNVDVVSYDELLGHLRDDEGGYEELAEKDLANVMTDQRQGKVFLKDRSMRQQLNYQVRHSEYKLVVLHPLRAHASSSNPLVGAHVGSTPPLGELHTTTLDSEHVKQSPLETSGLSPHSLQASNPPTHKESSPSSSDAQNASDEFLPSYAAATAIGDIFKSHCTEAWPYWKKVPHSTRDMWFTEFMSLKQSLNVCHCSRHQYLSLKLPPILVTETVAEFRLLKHSLATIVN